MTLEEIHATLTEAKRVLLTLHCVLPDDIASDTAFTLGQVTGLIAKADSLIRRDINTLMGKRDA